MLRLLTLAAIGIVITGMAVNLIRDPIKSDKSSSIFVPPGNGSAFDQNLGTVLAPMTALQSRVILDQRIWEANQERASDYDRHPSVSRCERDKLNRMNEGFDVSSIDCRRRFFEADRR
jgi:hypothetical protein